MMAWLLSGGTQSEDRDLMAEVTVSYKGLWKWGQIMQDRSRKHKVEKSSVGKTLESESYMCIYFIHKKDKI